MEGGGGGGGSIDILPIVRKGKPLDVAVFNKLKMAIESMGGNMERVEAAHCIVNPNSASMFEGYRVNLATQQIMSPSLFKKDDWKALDSSSKDTMTEVEERKKAREETLDILETHHSRFEWNNEGGSSSSVKVCLMGQGTNSETAWKIAQGGFGVVSSLDLGWFGSGS